MRTARLLALLLAAPVSASAATRLAIAHPPLDCVPYDRYTRITTPKTLGAASARLEFRAQGDGEAWYSIGMATEGSLWTAVMPRPIRPLAALEYRITTRSSIAGEESTPPIAVRVGDRPECPGDERSLPAVDAPIVVRVPRGAPLVPPVPSGFSPAGVVAAEDRASMSVLKTIAIGAGLAGGIAAGVALGGAAAADSPDVDLRIPRIAIERTAPLPGSTLFLSFDRVHVFLLLTGPAGPPFNFTWRFEMMGVGRDTVCVLMSGGTSVFQPLPITVRLTAPLVRTGACGSRFDVDKARLTLMVGPRVVFEAIHAPLPYHFEP